MVAVTFILLTFQILLISLHIVRSLNILAIIPYEGQSHFFVYEKYLVKLAEKGHNLTVISHFPREEAIPNYHDVSLAGEIGIGESVIPIERSYHTILRGMDYVVDTGTKDCKVLLDNKLVQHLWKSKRTFDLTVVQHFNSECGLALAYKVGAPIIGLTTSALMPWQYRTFGIPYNPSYTPFVLTGGFEPTLFERVEKTVLDFIFNFKYANARDLDRETLGMYFDDLPPLEELGREMKLLLLYQYFVISGPRLLPPNVIDVGGYHVMPSKPLPEDLQKFLNESKHGVIYISFGSMLKESSLAEHRMDAILDALGELPQRVIWKWKGDAFSGDPEKIYVSKWLPQNDLLAHPKVLAFFSHGGYLSTTEAAHHGVPMVVMPVMGDQPLNAENVERSGLGVKIALCDLNKDELLEKFRTVLDPEFRSRVRSLSRSYRDRPATAMNTAIFWTEFAAKHNITTTSYGASEVPLYQYLCLDVFVVLTIIVVLCVVIFVKVVRLMMAVVLKLGTSTLGLKRKRD